MNAPHKARLQAARQARKHGDPKRAIALLEPMVEQGCDSAEVFNTLGAAQLDCNQARQAITRFQAALKQDGDFTLAKQNLRAAQRLLASQVHRAADGGDWQPAAQFGESLLAAQRILEGPGEPIVGPFSTLGFRLTPAEQLTAARQIAAQFSDASDKPAQPLKPDLADRHLRVGYLSADFRHNAMAHLIGHLFAAHERDRIEVFALSLGPNDGSLYRRRIEKHAEHFIDLRRFDDAAAAAKIRALQLDLLVDLQGLAANHRAGILARRPAARQVTWLGYCLTTGAPWIDAYIGDSVALPPQFEAHFSERVLRVPDCYQIYSGEAPGPATDRATWGLPDERPVLAAMHGLFKIDDLAVALWSRILRATDAVLWVWVMEDGSLDRLRSRFAEHDIDPERIVPAYSVDKPAHIERLAHADLCLDTLLCNGHTTTSDALWAGVPVLTCPGDRFAQRVAASLCRAAGLPDLIVNHTEQYVDTAVELLKQPERLSDLRARLAQSKASAPLFDVPAFARKIEALWADCARLPASSGDDGKRRFETAPLHLIVVLGQWRSGTSALAGALRALGVYFGDDFAQLEGTTAHRDTWEDTALLKLLWRSFAEPNMTRLRDEARILNDLSTYLNRLERDARKAGKHMIGVKHPALALLADRLRDLDRPVTLLATDRSVKDSLASAQRIGWQVKTDALLLGMQRQYDATRQAEVAECFNFPDFVADPAATVDRLSQVLTFSPQADAHSAAMASLK